MTNTPALAIAAAAHQSTKGPKFGTGECLKQVRICYGVPAKYPDAASAWAATKHRHTITSPTGVPAGAILWWTGGSHGHGHIAISAGNGNCWSTDIKRDGYFDLCHIADIESSWGLKLEGWSEDVNDVHVFTPPVPKPKPLPPTRITRARALLVASLPHRSRADRAKVRAALALLPKR